MRRAVYPGSFDPLTNGHLSIIKRGLRIFDSIVVAIAHNPRKQSLFTVPEREQMIREATTADAARLEVTSFEGLLVDYCRTMGESVVLRGLRAVSDFEYEFQMANMNRKLDKDIETIFMMTGEDYFYISSQFVREVAALGGDVDGLVPPNVLEALRRKFAS